MNNDLTHAIKAAFIHKKVSKYLLDYVKPGITLKEISNKIDDKIKSETLFDSKNPLEKGIGFPVGLSINNCAAHYTPNYEEETVFLKETDIIKIDYGIHYNGIIIDSAFTLHFDPKYDEFINISKDLTNFAVKQCGPDAILGEIGSSIQEYIKGTEIEIDGKIVQLKNMEDLSGHLIKPYEIHAGKAVPNIAINYPLRMIEGEFYAIEPFLTTGDGKSILKEPNSHFMINNRKILNNREEKELYKSFPVLHLIKKNYGTLPFCQKWICELLNISLYKIDEIYEVNQTLKLLNDKNIINSYPPIYDIDNSIVSQFEHTIFIKENGVLNLTKNNFY
jgi:methionyl aminopeptidase